MKSNILENQLRLYGPIPKWWSARPKTMAYHTLPSEEHYKDGWREYETPKHDSVTHKLGELVYDKEMDLVTNEVIKLTNEELEYRRKAQVPYSVTPTQGRILLSQIPGSIEGESLLNDVLRLMPESKTEPIHIYWEYALTWDRDSQFVSQMGGALGMTEADIDEFFMQASLIND